MFKIFGLQVPALSLLCQRPINAETQIAGGTQGQQCQHSKSFSCQEYYPVLRLSLNLLTCMYSHCIYSPKTGITLLIMKKGFVCSEPPIVICTVTIVVVVIVVVIVILVNIAMRRQLLSHIPPLANDIGQGQAGGEPTRCSAAPSPSAPLGMKFWYCSLVLIPLLRTVFIVVLVLLLLPKCQSQIVKLVQGGQQCWQWLRPGVDPRFPACCLSARQDDPHQSPPFPRRPLGSISGAICGTSGTLKSRVCTSVLPFFVILDVFPVEISIIRPRRCWRFDSPPLPWPIPIPISGTPRPSMRWILSCLF